MGTIRLISNSPFSKKINSIGQEQRHRRLAQDQANQRIINAIIREAHECIGPIIQIDNVSMTLNNVIEVIFSSPSEEKIGHRIIPRGDQNFVSLYHLFRQRVNHYIVANNPNINQTEARDLFIQASEDNQSFEESEEASDN